jgi:flagellar basal-body rod protein FlgG
MLEGMYSAAAGMAAQQQRLDTVANDLANVNTAGYKPVRVAFRDLVYGEAGRGTARGVRIGAGAAATDIGRSSAQGELQQTGQELDVALDGLGFLAVRDANGPALTRDGQLRLDDQGRITTQAGALLDPPVKLPAGTTEKEVRIATDGSITVRGTRIGGLRIVTVPATSGLQGGDGNLFRTTAASGAAGAAPRTTRVIQGSLEGSAVDLATAMADMTIAQRAFQMASKAIQMQDQVLEYANGVKR